MTYTNALDETFPAGSEAAGTIDNIIREFRLQIKERLASLTTGVDVDPLQLKAGAIPSGYTITNPVFAGTYTVFPTVNTVSLSSSLVGIATGADITIFTMSVVAGTWLVQGQAQVSVFNGSAPDSGNIVIGVKNNINSVNPNTISGLSASPSTLASYFVIVPINALITVASPATLTFYINKDSATATVNVSGSATNLPTFASAIRVA